MHSRGIPLATSALCALFAALCASSAASAATTLLSGAGTGATCNPGSGAPKTFVSQSGGGQIQVVATTLSQPLSVIVVDRNCLPIAGQRVTFTVVAGGGSVSPAQVDTDANGVASTTATLGTIAGLNTFEVSAGGVSNSPLGYGAQGDPGPAASLTVTGIPSPTPTGGAASATVRLFDSFGNVATGYLGRVGFTSSDAAATLPAQYSFTAADAGVHTFAGAIVFRTAGIHSVTARDTANASLSGSQTGISITSAGFAKVSGDGQSGTVGATLAAPFVVRLTDANGAVVGATITFAVAAGGGSVSPTSAVTDANGNAQTTATLGTVAGSAQSFTANAPGGISVTFSASALAGAAATLALVAPGSTSAGVAVDGAVTARDAFGNVATGYRGTVTFSSNDTRATLPAAYVFTAADGGTRVFAAGLLLVSAGNRSISVTDGTRSAAATIAVAPAAADRVLVQSGNGQSGVVGQALAAPLVVSVVDAFDNPVPDVEVAFGAISGGSVSPALARTDAFGRTQTTATLGPVAAATGPAFSAAAASLAGVVFSASAAPSAATSLVLGGVPFATPAGAVHDLSVEARDAFGNVATGYRGTVAFSSTDAQATLPSPMVFDGARAGRALLPQSLVLRSSGDVTVTVSDGTLTRTNAASVSAAAPASLLQVSGAGQSGTVAQPLAAPLRVRVRDGFGNPVAGVRVAVSAPLGGSAAAATSDAAGEVSLPATLGTVAGEQSFVANAGALTTTFQQTARAAPAVALHIVAQPATLFTGDAVAVAVSARDAFGNADAGYRGTVTLTTSDASAELPAAVAFTAADAGTRAFSGLVFHQAGSHTVTARDASSLVATSAALLVAARPRVPELLELVGGDRQSALVGQPYGAPIVVRVLDGNGEPVPDALVSFTTIRGTGSISPAVVASDVDGLAVASARAGTRAGAETFGAALVLDPSRALVLDLTASPGAVSSVRAVVESARPEACTEGGVLFFGQDAFGNLTSAPAALELSASSASGAVPQLDASAIGGVVGVASSTGSLAGSARVGVQLDEADDVTLSWSSPSLAAGAPGSAGVVALRFVVGAVSALASTVEAASPTAVGGGAPVLVTVTPQDDCGLPLGAGHQVAVAASYGTVSAAADQGDGTYLASFRVDSDGCQSDAAIVAVYVDGALLDSQPALATTCPPVSGPRITTTPRLNAVVGLPYVIDSDRALDATGGAVVWLKLAGPAQLHVDPVTGFVGFIPTRTGQETVTVSASNAAGEDTLTFPIAVSATGLSPPIPVVTLTPDTGPADLQVSADASASVPGTGGAIVSTQWDFGDGSPPEQGVTATHLFAIAQSYVVRVEVVDEQGNTGSASFPVAATDGGVAPPSARIVSTTLPGEDELTVTLACDCATGGAPVTGYRWEFGDGTASDVAELTRTFAPGGWSVRLTVVDDNGLVATDETFISVARAGNLPPLVSASATPVSGTAPFTTTFRGSFGDLDGHVAEIHWDFGDGGSSDEPTPTYTFEREGRAHATLTVVDDRGLASSSVVDIDVVLPTGELAPEVLSLPRTTARVGEPFQYDEDGRASARGSRPLTWLLGKQVGDELVGAPDGMEVDPFTGEVRFTPQPGQEGSVSVVLVAWNAAGSDAQEFTLEIAAGDSAEDGARPTDPSGVEGCGCAGSGEGDAFAFAGALVGFAWLGRRRHARGSVRR